MPIIESNVQGNRKILRPRLIHMIPAPKTIDILKKIKKFAQINDNIWGNVV